MLFISINSYVDVTVNSIKISNNGINENYFEKTEDSD